MLKRIAAKMRVAQDPIADLLSGDKEIKSLIKAVLTNSMDDSVNNNIILLVDRINSLLEDQSLHKLQEDIQITQDLLQFQHVLEIFFVNRSINDQETISVFKCIYTLTILCNHAPEIENKMDFFIKLMQIFYHYEKSTEFLQKAIIFFLPYQQFSDYLGSTSFYLEFSNYLFSHIEFAEYLDKFLDLILPYTNTINPQANQWGGILLKFNEYNNLKKFSPPNTLVQIKLFILMLKIHSASTHVIASNYILNDGLETLLNLMENNCIDRISEVFLILVFIPEGTINTPILQFIIDSIFHQDVAIKARLQFFSTIYDILSDESINIFEYESMTIDFTKLVNKSQEPTKQFHEMIFRIFHVLSRRRYSKINSCIFTLFRLLFSFLVSHQTIVTFFEDLKRLIDTNQTTPNFIASHGLFKLLISISESQKLKYILFGVPHAAQIFQQCYQSANVDDVRWRLFKLIIDIDYSIDHKEQFIQYCSMIYSNQTTISICTNFLDYIVQQHSENMIKILIHSFKHSQASVNAFIFHSFPFTWLNDIIEQHTFSEELITDLLCALTYQQFVRQLTSWISSLPLTHQLFLFKEENLFRIAFCEKDKQTILMVPALVPLFLDRLPKLSAGSIFLLAKYGMNDFLRRDVKPENSKIMQIMANYYITPRNWRAILSISVNISPLVDLSIDHFPFFEIPAYTSSANIQVKTPCEGISFWFKALPEINENVTILHSPLITISYDHNFAIFQVNDQIQRFCFQRNTWSFVALQIIEGILHLNFNDYNCKFPIVDCEQVLNNIIIGAKDDTNPETYYIGGSIRFFKKPSPIVPTIREYGPGHLGKISNTEENVAITPFSKIKTSIHQICYRGFPTMLTRTAFMNDIITGIIQTSNPDTANDWLNMLLNAIETKVAPFKKLMKSILMIIKSKHSILSNDIIVRAIRNATKATIFLTDFDIWQIFPKMIKSCIKKFMLCPEFHKVFCGSTDILPMLCSQLMLNHNDSLWNIIAFLSSSIPTVENLLHIRNIMHCATPEQLTKMIKSLIAAEKDHFLSEFSKVFSFEFLIDKMLVHQYDINELTMELIFLIQMNEPNFIAYSHLSVYAFIPFIYKEEFWRSMFSFLVGKNKVISMEELQGEKNIKNKHVFLMISSLLACSVFVINTALNSPNANEEAVHEYENIINTYIAIFANLCENDETLLISVQFLSAMKYYIPFIVSPEMIFSVSEEQINVGIATNYDEQLTNWAKELLHLWKFTDDVLDHILDQDFMDYFSYSITPYVPVFGILIQRYVPGFAFPVEYKKVSETIFKDKNSFYKLFKIMIIANSTTNRFNDLLRFSLFLPSIYSSYVAEEIVSLFVSPRIYHSPISSLVQFLKFLNEGYRNNIFGPNTTMISTSFIAFLPPALMNVENIPSCIPEIQSIMTLIFDCVKGAEIFNVLSFINSKIYAIPTLFASLDFINCFFVNILKIAEYKDERYESILMLFLQSVIFTQSYSHMVDQLSDPSLKNFINEIHNFKSANEINDWINNNEEAYYSAFAQLEMSNRAMHDGIFIDFHSFSRSDYDSHKQIIKFSVKLKEKQKLINLQQFLITKAHQSFLLTGFTDRKMRKSENQFFHFWYNIQIGSQQRAHRSPNSFHLSQFTWPGQTSRLIIPSYIKLPDIEVGTKFCFSGLPAQRNPDLFHNNTIEMKLPEGFEHDIFQSIIEMNLSPLMFSYMTHNNPYITYQSFISVFAKEPGFIAFNCTFTKYTPPIPSVILHTHSLIIILISASLENDYQLVLQPLPQIQYKALLDLIMIGSFGMPSLFCGHLVIRIPYKHIISVNEHLTNHKPISYVISTLLCSEFIISQNKGAFPQIFVKVLNHFVARFQSRLPNKCGFLFTYDLQRATKLWSQYKMSNYEYLLFLNRTSGRSFSDITQYPVFPWIISDYNNNEITSIRDLSKPMGQLSEDRAKVFDTYYQSTNYFYGSHYSFAAAIHSYMIRVPPFTYYHWDLNEGWDDPFRMFQSVAITYTTNSEKGQSEVTELIPEFFAFPEMLENVNNFISGTDFNVKLPPWAQGPIHFSTHNKYELEKSQNINQWIDLIFGYQQNGPAAIAAKNLFFPASYHSYQTDDEATLTLQCENWGQCPIQLFKKAHIHRKEQKKRTNLCAQPLNLAVHHFEKGTQFHISPSSALILLHDLTIHAYIDYITGNVMFSYSDPSIRTSSFSLNTIQYVSPQALAVSANNLFIAVTFPTQYVWIARIIYDGNIVKNLDMVASFSPANGSKIIINGTDLITGAYTRNRLVIRLIANAVITSIVDLESPIVQAEFDEVNGWIWCLTKNTINILTVNVRRLCDYEFNYGLLPTSLVTSHSLNTADIDRPVFVGFQDGSVAGYLYNVKTNTISEVFRESIVDCAIKSISLHRSKFAVHLYDFNQDVHCIYDKTELSSPPPTISCV